MQLFTVLQPYFTKEQENNSSFLHSCPHHLLYVAAIVFLRGPNAFALNSSHSVATADSQAEGPSSPVEADTLKIEEVQPPATGTRKAKVLYDYDAADSSELSLLADEVRFTIDLHHFD